MVLLHLTEEGKEKRKIARDAVVRFNQNVLSNLPKTKVKHFFEVLDRLNVILDEQDVFANHETNN